ncbi:MAG: ABC transporter ATP-binding protein [Desulfamplus sp.]|nr:ABC transporter ATP-binding protein [Desulfamplus sp.]
MIEAKNITFAYNTLPLVTPVVKDVSLKFEAGKFYSILGPNGCGKTTLLDLMIGHLKPTSGKVLLNLNGVSHGTDILSIDRRETAKYISLVAQNYSINFPFTVKEVVMMGRHPYIGRFSNPSKDDIEIVNRVIEQTEIRNFANRKITDLSGGERQRCLFARALSQDTPLLFLDEAFSNMDINHTIRLLNLVKKEVKERNRTVVSVFHDINIAAIWSDELIFMQNGEIVCSGKTDDVMDENIIERVFHVKLRVEYNPYSNSKLAYFKGYNG